MQIDINKKITIGYFWNLLTKWLNRSIGLISTLCLVRILSPEDFGIVALASIILAFFVMISDAGTGKYLIKSANVTNEMLNSAWSLNIALKMLCSTIIAIFAKPLTDYMNNPELCNVLLICCFIPIISSLKNIGLVIYEKDLNYKPLTKLSVTVKIIVLPITLSLAFYLQSYWSLIVGLLISEIFTVIGSYLVHEYRPTWSIVGWKKQRSFSKWHLISVSTGYIRSRVDTFLLGRYLSNDAIGLYRVGQEFAWLPFSELIAPATNSIYSGLSQLTNHKEEYHKTILKYLTLSYLLVIPSIMAIYTFDELFTSILLGDKWAEAAPIIGILAILMLSMPLNICLQSILTSLSKLKFLIIIDLIMISSIIFLILILLNKNSLTIVDYLEYRVFILYGFILLLCLLYKLTIQLSISKILLTILVPVIPSAITIFLVKKIEAYLPFINIFNFALLLLSGILIYSFLMIICITIIKNKFEEYNFIIHSLKKVGYLNITTK